jgi:hypothetical protein
MVDENSTVTMTAGIKNKNNNGPFTQTIISDYPATIESVGA